MIDDFRSSPKFSRLRSCLGRCAFQFIALVLIVFQSAVSHPARSESLDDILQTSNLTVLADVKHGVRERVSFFSSSTLFEAMTRAGVRHVAIEMPRVLGAQAMTIETADDVEAFAQDVIRSGQWHFTDPDHPEEEATSTQYRVATALGRQVLLAKKFGIDPIFYDFNNPLGDFVTYNDPVYRCLTELTDTTWLSYGLNGAVTKAQRDAAIMRERLSHDDELAAFIEQQVKRKGGGKLVVIPGYAHAVMSGGLADQLSKRLGLEPRLVAVFKDSGEEFAFHAFLWEQAHLLSIDLSRPAQHFYTIADGRLSDGDAPVLYGDLNASGQHNMPAVCAQVAHAD